MLVKTIAYIRRMRRGSRRIRAGCGYARRLRQGPRASGPNLDVSIVDNVKPPVRQLVESIQDGDTLASLTKRLGQKKSTVQYRLRAAIRDGYVVETDKTYKLGAPMPSPTCALPTVEQLGPCRSRPGKGGKRCRGCGYMTEAIALMTELRSRGHKFEARGPNALMSIRRPTSPR